MSADGGLGGGGDESDLRDPVVVVVFLDGVLAVTLDVPELDISVRSGGENVSSVRGNSAGEDFLGMSVFGESLGGLSGSEIPKSHGLVP